LNKFWFAVYTDRERSTSFGCDMRLIALLPFFAGALVGQTFEAGVHGGVSRLDGKDIGTFRVGDVTRLSLQDGWRIGFRMTLNNWTYFGQEYGYTYNRTAIRDPESTPSDFGTAFHQGSFNFLAYATPEGKTVRPFISGGGHFSNYLIPGLSVSSGAGSNKFGFNYGGGLKVRVSEMFLIRFDARQYVNGKPFDFPNQSGMIRQLEISAGFSFVM